MTSQCGRAHHGNENLSKGSQSSHGLPLSRCILLRTQFLWTELPSMLPPPLRPWVAAKQGEKLPSSQLTESTVPLSMAPKDDPRAPWPSPAGTEKNFLEGRVGRSESRFCVFQSWAHATDTFCWVGHQIHFSTSPQHLFDGEEKVIFNKRVSVPQRRLEKKVMIFNLHYFSI